MAKATATDPAGYPNVRRARGNGGAMPVQATPEPRVGTRADGGHQPQRSRDAKPLKERKR